MGRDEEKKRGCGGHEGDNDSRVHEKSCGDSTPYKTCTDASVVFFSPSRSYRLSRTWAGLSNHLMQWGLTQVAIPYLRVTRHPLIPRAEMAQWLRSRIHHGWTVSPNRQILPSFILSNEPFDHNARREHTVLRSVFRKSLFTKIFWTSLFFFPL